MPMSLESICLTPIPAKKELIESKFKQKRISSTKHGRVASPLLNIKTKIK